ncbi:Mucin family member [Komagataella phaffii CBS 7435]|uniref:Mucin family member n=2 Tax=Komagataella phaffii TaxID=460519 RepID=C4QVR8_KOMPG|nr:Mucin family member [Komagataella phaffii GS115]CAY67341.1 Mucin family member [Komagataella phaffii GS115]CCA36444.1 Mucin family member [Komagataella phaffii CBS 7435]
MINLNSFLILTVTLLSPALALPKNVLEEQQAKDDLAKRAVYTNITSGTLDIPISFDVSTIDVPSISIPSFLTSSFLFDDPAVTTSQESTNANVETVSTNSDDTTQVADATDSLLTTEVAVTLSSSEDESPASTPTQVAPTGGSETSTTTSPAPVFTFTFEPPTYTTSYGDESSLSSSTQTEDTSTTSSSVPIFTWPFEPPSNSDSETGDATSSSTPSPAESSGESTGFIRPSIITSSDLTFPVSPSDLPTGGSVVSSDETSYSTPSPDESPVESSDAPTLVLPPVTSSSEPPVITVTVPPNETSDVSSDETSYSTPSPDEPPAESTFVTQSSPLVVTSSETPVVTISEPTTITPSEVPPTLSTESSVETPGVVSSIPPIESSIPPAEPTTVTSSEPAIVPPIVETTVSSSIESVESTVISEAPSPVTTSAETPSELPSTEDTSVEVPPTSVVSSPRETFTSSDTATPTISPLPYLTPSVSSQETSETIETSTTLEVPSPATPTQQASSSTVTTPIVGTDSVVGTAPSQVPYPAVGSTSTTRTQTWIPTSLIIATSTQPSGTARSTQTASGSRDEPTSTLPKAISLNPTGEPEEGYELITVGFKEPLNYAFVVGNSMSPVQIFEYLPGVLCYPYESELDASKITVLQLVPYTSPDVSYIITVAEVYFKSSLIGDLQSEIHDTSSSLYSNPDPSERALANLIDPRVPITGLNLGSTSSQTSGNGSGNSDNSSNSDGDGLDSTESQGSSNTGKVAGIAVGSVMGFTLYLGSIALFYRYRKNKSKLASDEAAVGSSESPETTQISNVSYSSPGAIVVGSTNSHIGSNSSPEVTSSTIRGDSTHSNLPKISGPVSTYNSLGW